MTLRRISPAEAHALMREQGYAYLDVRTPVEVALGHPEGAYNVPWQVPTASGVKENPEFEAIVLAVFGADAKLVVGCEVGRRSRAAAERLLAAGAQEVVDLRAGFEGARDPFGRIVERGWRASGLPCATELLPGRDHVSLAARRQRR